MITRKKPLKRSSPPLKRTPLRKVSKKRAKQIKVYYSARIPFLEKHPVCQVWLKERNWEQIIGGDYPAYRRQGLQDHIPAETLIAVWGADRSTDVHHKAKRSGRNYLDESTWMAVCRPAHERIHNNASWARERGYLLT